MYKIRYFILILVLALILSISLVLAHPLIPNDSRFDSWNESNPAGNNWGQEIIKLLSAWDFTVGSVDFPIAVVDLGFDIEHEDLEPNLNLEESDKFDTLKTGDEDYDFHGTMVAGITAAQGNNNLGVAGTMWEADLRIYNVTYPTGEVTPLFKWKRTSTPLSVATMMLFAIDKGARVINLSYGYCLESSPNCPKQNRARLEELELFDRLFRAVVRHASIKGKDVLFIIAAGNNSNDIQTASPARAWSEFDNVISVTAVNKDEDLSYYSNWGDITVAAPGGDGLPFDSGDIFNTLPGGYGHLGGTSQAAPFVSGLAGLIYSKAEERGQDITAAEVKNLIVQGAIKGGKYVSGPDGYQIPIINAYESLKLLVGPPVPPDSVELVSIKPSCNTTLQRGTVVDFDVTVAYDLDSVELGVIDAQLGADTGVWVVIGEDIEVERGPGTVIFHDSIDVDWLYETIEANTIYLALWLAYQEDLGHYVTLMWKPMPECSYFITSY